MKKAGIITLFGEYNFGNRLQNYAVQQILKSQGLNVETIKFIMTDYKDPRINTKIDKDRLAKFKEFNNEIEFAREILYMNMEAPSNFADEYNYIVLGSDQIWNHTFSKSFSHKNLGSFVPSYKRFSFSASFGVNYAPEKGSTLFEDCKRYLYDMKAISVRENEGREIVKELTGREDAQVLLDPTMLLEVEQWEKMIRKPNRLKSDKFIIKNFLGNVSDKIINELNRIAQENDCEIIDISDKNSPFYDVGPREFLYLEKNAFLVSTDSFHSCVFSILFSTPFIAFKREDNIASMYSRIETLLEKFNMQDRKFNGRIEKKHLQQEFSEVQEILNMERKRANEFLEKALA